MRFETTKVFRGWNKRSGPTAWAVWETPYVSEIKTLSLPDGGSASLDPPYKAAPLDVGCASGSEVHQTRRCSGVPWATTGRWSVGARRIQLGRHPALVGGVEQVDLEDVEGVLLG